MGVIFIMKLSIQKCKPHEKIGPRSVEITERLPSYISKVWDVEFYYTVERLKDYYLLILDVSAYVRIECQRCMNDFDYHYKNINKIAVCKSEEIAERVMALYEPLVSQTNEVDLVEIITDDLHLFCPENHEDVDKCIINN